jgi:predicted AlkP superfamily phosphohydrolase/phosphomutase
MANRTLFIGLDGATFTLLDAFTRHHPGEGVVMPTMARLMREGFQAPLRSTALPLTPPAWTTFMTGRTPGHHGVFDFVRFQDRGHECLWTLTDSTNIRCETIWSIASRHRRRVISLNFPMMAPPEAVNGSLVSGFVSWKHLRRNITPTSLYDRLKRIPGFNPKEIAWDFKREDQVGEDMSQADLEAWVHSHRLREEQWFRVAETLLHEDQPDFFAVMFDGTDKLQHQTWHVLDPRLQPEHPTPEHARLREMVLGYYRRLDEYLARLIELAGPDAQVFLASDHGFTAAFNVVRINRYLGELGYLVWHEDDGSLAAQRREGVNFAYLDWSRTLAFCPTPSSNGIVIRTAREPGQPGVPIDQYQAFRAKLIDDLRALRTPAGEQVVTQILLREEAFPGEAMENAPDLTITLNDHGFVSVRNKTPVVEKRPYPAGTHHPDGILVACGPGIAPDHSRELVQLLDMAPILLYSLGLAIPEDFEGTVPGQLFTPETFRERPVRIGPRTRRVDRQGTPQSGPSADERAEILGQMRALGYLED